MLDKGMIHILGGKEEDFFTLLRMRWVEANVQGQPHCIWDPLGDTLWGLHCDGLSPLTPVSPNKLSLQLIFRQILYSHNNEKSHQYSILEFFILVLGDRVLSWNSLWRPDMLLPGLPILFLRQTLYIALAVLETCYVNQNDLELRSTASTS